MPRIAKTITTKQQPANPTQHATLPKRERREERYANMLRRTMPLFTLSGNTHDGSIADNSSRVLPEPDEIDVRTTGDVVEIVRDMGDDDDSIVVLAGAKATRTHSVGDLSLLAHEWRQCYEFYARPTRAMMLEVDDPMHMTREQVEAIVAHAKLAKSEHYNAKIKMQVPNANGVSVSRDADKVTDSRSKRITWYGHAGFALARWFGAKGYSVPEAKHAFAALNIPIGESAIVGGVYAGRAGRRGDPAPVTDEQAKIIHAKVVEYRKQHPTTDAPTAVTPPAPITPVAPKPTGKGSRRKIADMKLEAAMRARKQAGKTTNRNSSKRRSK